MNITALVAYSLCFAVSALCALLLLRSWRRSDSRLAMWCGVAFSFIAVSNFLLVGDLVLYVDLSLIRAVTIAIGLGFLVYGVALEEASR